jgi:thiol:disulfide interchange protein
MKLKVFVIMAVCAALLCGCREGKAENAAADAQKETQPKMAQGQIAWVYTLGEALALAQSSKKPVMVDFFAEWCGWCKKLDKDVYTDKDVIALSKEFVCAKVDTDKFGQDASKYGVQGLPTIVFMNADGTVIDKIVGYNPAPQFAAVMKKALKK